MASSHGVLRTPSAGLQVPGVRISESRKAMVNMAARDPDGMVRMRLNVASDRLGAGGALAPPAPLNRGRLKLSVRARRGAGQNPSPGARALPNFSSTQDDSMTNGGSEVTIQQPLLYLTLDALPTTGYLIEDNFRVGNHAATAHAFAAEYADAAGSLDKFQLANNPTYACLANRYAAGTMNPGERPRLPPRVHSSKFSCCSSAFGWSRTTQQTPGRRTFDSTTTPAPTS